MQIILAVYNGEKYLEEQLHSFFDQSYQDFQLLIRDNHSTDTTPEILRQWEMRYPERIQVFYGEQNLGVIGNFAFLLEQTTAPYVMFSDGDDIWLPQKIEKTFSTMQFVENSYGEETPILIHTDLTIVNEALEPIHPSFWRYSHLDGKQKITLNRALTENVVTGCTMMLNRSLVDLVTPIPTSSVPMHDAWIALIASAFGMIVPLPEATILYRQHGNNDSGASQYGLLSHIKKIQNPNTKEKITSRRMKRFEQAEELFQRYRTKLTKEQQEIIEAYLKIPSSSTLKRIPLLWKNNFFESGLLRKAFQLFKL